MGNPRFTQHVVFDVHGLRRDTCRAVIMGSMGRSKRTPVIAAGGIVVRRNSKAAIAIVQRKRDNAWVLPKGKIKSREKLISSCAEKNRVNHFVAHLNATALLYHESADCHVPVTERAIDVLLLAQSGHALRAQRCLLLGVKRTLGPRIA